MASVKNLTIKLQTGSDNTYYASWDFDEETNSSTSGGTIKAGDLVSIKSGSTYYNGVSIPAWVMEDQWYVVQVSGDRAVLGENKSKSNNIMSPIKVSNLTLIFIVGLQYFLPLIWFKRLEYYICNVLLF